VSERKIFKNLCTRIAGWTSKCDGEWAHHALVGKMSEEASPSTSFLPQSNGQTKRLFTIVTHNSHYVNVIFFNPFFAFYSRQWVIFLGGEF
jgi:hypothetical protein